MASPMKDHPLGLAARYNDSDAEEHGFVETVTKQGLELSDVLYLAEQRAIRVVMLQEGRFEEFQRAYATNQPATIVLSVEERLTVELLKVVYIDGILIGWRGRDIAIRQQDEKDDSGGG